MAETLRALIKDNAESSALLREIGARIVGGFGQPGISFEAMVYDEGDDTVRVRYWSTQGGSVDSISLPHAVAQRADPEELKAAMDQQISSRMRKSAELEQRSREQAELREFDLYRRLRTKYAAQEEAAVS